VDGVTDEIVMDNVQYDTENLLTQFDYGNGLQAAFSYDSGDRLIRLDITNGATSFLDLNYTYDNNSNITQLVNGWRDTESDWHSQTELYSYDGLDRLTSAHCTSWSHSYSYDKVGNRTVKDSITYTINSVNGVTELSDGTSFTYDDNGNRTQKTKGTDTWMYTYDHANRLTKVEKNSTTEGEYAYDGSSKRLQATENNVTTTYIYSGLSILYEETTTGTACYIYGPMGRIAKKTTINNESHTFYYHTDHLGSTRLVTDESKNIITTVAYHPFGGVYRESSEHHLYTGKQKDATGLYYYGARYYDPETGRFITRDPLRGDIISPQSLNRYTYCQNNPLKYTDPWGLDKDFEKDGVGKLKIEPYENDKNGLLWYNCINYLPWGDGHIILVTPIVRSGNIGVAVGEYWSPDEYGFYKSRGYGIVVFFFEGNKIVDYIFISFDKYLDSEGNLNVEGFYTELWGWLAKHAKSYEEFTTLLDDFEKAVRALEDYCRNMEKNYDAKGTLFGVGGSIVSVVLGILSYIVTCVALGIAGIIVGVVGIGLGLYYNHQEHVWGNRRDLVDKVL
jgi:RHS repeat-associated protein